MPIDNSEKILCEDLFDGLAKSDPEELFRLISEGLEAHHLTFAAESLGRIRGHHKAHAMLVLVGLLAHKDAVVREGAVYGLDLHTEGNIYKSKLLSDHLMQMKVSDPSPGVRAAVEEVLLV